MIIGVVLGTMFLLAVGLIALFVYRRRKHASECIFTIKVYKNILFSYLNCCFKLYHVSQNTTLSYLLNRSFFDNLHCPFFFLDLNTQEELGEQQDLIRGEKIIFFLKRMSTPVHSLMDR